MLSQGLWVFIGFVFLAVFLLAAEHGGSRARWLPACAQAPGGAPARDLRRIVVQRHCLVASPEVPAGSLTRPAHARDATGHGMVGADDRSVGQGNSRLPGRTARAGARGRRRLRRAFLSKTWTVALLGFIIGLTTPILSILATRARRLDKLEEQMPEAMDVIKRALKAGHPFNQSLKLVAEDMDQPIAREFDLTFADMSYGNDPRSALLGLLQRVPSMAVMALVTAVLVQRETGGNLAENPRAHQQRRARPLSLSAPAQDVDCGRSHVGLDPRVDAHAALRCSLVFPSRVRRTADRTIRAAQR